MVSAAMGAAGVRLKAARATTKGPRQYRAKWLLGYDSSGYGMGAVADDFACCGY
jgi:hypothetical protein